MTSRLCSRPSGVSKDFVRRRLLSCPGLSTLSPFLSSFFSGFALFLPLLHAGGTLEHFAKDLVHETEELFCVIGGVVACFK